MRPHYYVLFILMLFSKGLQAQYQVNVSKDTLSPGQFIGRIQILGEIATIQEFEITHYTVIEGDTNYFYIGKYNVSVGVPINFNTFSISTEENKIELTTNSIYDAIYSTRIKILKNDGLFYTYDY